MPVDTKNFTISIRRVWQLLLCRRPSFMRRLVFILGVITKYTKEPSLGNFLTIDGHFNCVTSRVKVLG